MLCAIMVVMRKFTQARAKCLICYEKRAHYFAFVESTLAMLVKSTLLPFLGPKVTIFSVLVVRHSMAQ